MLVDYLLIITSYPRRWVCIPFFVAWFQETSIINTNLDLKSYVSSAVIWTLFLFEAEPLPLQFPKVKISVKREEKSTANLFSPPPVHKNQVANCSTASCCQWHWCKGLLNTVIYDKSALDCAVFLSCSSKEWVIGFRPNPAEKFLSQQQISISQTTSYRDFQWHQEMQRAATFWTKCCFNAGHSELQHLPRGDRTDFTAENLLVV